ncbi:MAG: DoxX family membrane protein [Prevotellaceae bacterium]|jgi:uncharacterized membrane protein YphA (DoxX/SURF4 family)|nr:DoxX family membrane protein [Prevotellaceae bacterium]
MKKIIVNLLRFIFAAVFIFSGYVKAIDPLGFTYKITEYLEKFGGFFQSFDILAFPFAILNSSLELLIGIALLLGIYRKKTIILAMLFMAIYTPLTLYIAIFNPVTDCGCFGDALVISNWTTFWKNIVLDIIIVTLFIYRNDIIPFLGRKIRVIAVIFAAIFCVGLSVYCYRHLPLIDFRPYKIGTYIPEKMEYPEDAARDEFATILTYKNNANGEQRDFKLNGSTVIDIKDNTEYAFGDFAKEWTFVAQTSKLIKKGYEPPIHDFSITTDEDGDITEEVLADTNYTFLLIAYKLEKADQTHSAEINKIYDYAQSQGYKFYCLHSSLNEDLIDYVQEGDAKYPFATADETTLKTIIRANPGLLLLKNGTILNKWHYNDLPAFDAPLAGSKLGKVQLNNAVGKTLTAAGIFLVPIIILIGFRIITVRKKKK